MKKNEIEKSKAEYERIRKIGFYPLLFVMLPLPYQNPKKEHTFIRKYNNMELEFYCKKGVPSGKYPRSLMSLIVTQYILQKDDIKDEKNQRTIDLDGISVTAQKLGFSNHGGKKSPLFALHNSMEQLGETVLFSRSKIVTDLFSFTQKRNIPIFESVETTWYKKNLKQPELFKSQAIISPQFSEIINKKAVPIDIYAYNSFSRARAQDVYAWLVRKLFKQDTIEEITFKSLIPQFFDKPNDHAKDEFIDSLEKVLRVYSNAKVKISKTGLVLYPSKLHIEEKNKGWA